MGIVSLSDAVEIRNEGDVDFKKNTTVFVGMDDANSSDKDTIVVVIRYTDNVVQVLDKTQCRMTKEGDTYKVECKGIWRYGYCEFRNRCVLIYKCCVRTSKLPHLMYFCCSSLEEFSEVHERYILLKL